MFLDKIYKFFGFCCVFTWFFCLQIEATAFYRFFEFDEAGNLKKVVPADNCSIEYEYDQMQQLVKVDDSDGKVFSYQYDVNGNCLQVNDENGVTKYEYDLLNRLVNVARDDTVHVRYSYDLRGRIHQILYLSGHLVSYSYDSADRLVSVDSPQGKTEYIYDQANNTLSKIILPTGVTTEYGYDKAKRIISISHRHSDKTLIAGFQYLFDGNGNRIRTVETGKRGSKVIDFSYDKLNRLVYVKYPERFEKYTYDDLGNRLTKETSLGLIHYKYDENNRLKKYSENKLSYDDRGNLIKKQSPNKTVEYAYDVHDNLISYRDHTYNIQYSYDGEGRRISKTVNGEKTFYINDTRSPITQVLLETTEEKIPKMLYIYGLSRLTQVSPSGYYSYLYDYPDRNVIGLINEREQFCNIYNYEAFGLPSGSISTTPNPFTYAGEAYEMETGLVFLRNRYYDPEIGRFISADPSLGKLSNPQTFNPYAYADNNPVNFIDPLGLRSAKACAYPAGTMTTHGESLTGHGFWVLTKDNGEQTTVGRYPGGPREIDELTPNTAYYEWPATDKQINEIVKVIKQGSYLGVAGNCIDGLERGLEVLGVEHPSFNVMGVSTPSKAVIWLESLNGQDNFKKAMEQDMRFVADPDRFWPSTVKPTCPISAVSSGDLGGVSFDQTAQLIGTLSDILGATYDPVSGQLILVGSQNYSLPPMDFDDLAVAVRSIYGLGGKPPQNPGVSIDWNPDNKTKLEKFDFNRLSPMVVRYEGVTEGTRFGKVMFEADRLLKCLSNGKDNITKKELKPNVRGFISLPNRYSNKQLKMERNSSFFDRMWFVPKDVVLTKTADGNSIVFDRAEMEVLTESKRNNRQQDNVALEDFAKHFTDHFDEFAKLYPILIELKHLGKITAIVKWMQENSIPLDLSLFSHYIPKDALTPSATPAIFSLYTRPPEIRHIIGGVALQLSEGNFRQVCGIAPDALQQSVLYSRPSENEMAWDMDRSFGNGFKAIAHTVERTLKIGNIRKAFTDMRFHLSGEFPFELVRYYNSFNERSSGFGKGWELNSSSLHFRRGKGQFKWEERNIVRDVFPDILVSDEGREFVYRLHGFNLKSLPIYTTNGLAFVLEEQEKGNFILHKEDARMFFDSEGKLLRKVDKQGQGIEYTYDHNDRLIAMAHRNGKKIQLEYENERIARSIGPGGKIISYQYDANNQLYSVADQVGPIVFYSYDSEKNLDAIYDAKKRVLFGATYDNYHRAITLTNGATEINKEFSLKDHAERIQGPNHLNVFNQYDSNYRLLKSNDSFGRHIEISYQNGVIQPTLIKNGFGQETKYGYDRNGNLISIINSAGIEKRFWYDPTSNRLNAALDGRKRAEIYRYDEKGRLKSFFPYGYLISEDLTSGQTTFHYEPIEAVEYEIDDQTGTVTAIKKGNELAKLFSYNVEGRLTEISDPYGYKIRRKFDNRSRLCSIDDTEGRFEYTYNERDQVIEISSPVGHVSYNYDEVGNLIWIKDANGYETILEYDENYNLTKIIDAEGGVTHYRYNNAHGLAQIILPNGSSKKILYDALNRPIQEVIGD